MLNLFLEFLIEFWKTLEWFDYFKQKKTFTRISLYELDFRKHQFETF